MTKEDTLQSIPGWYNNIPVKGDGKVENTDSDLPSWYHGIPVKGTTVNSENNTSNQDNKNNDGIISEQNNNLVNLLPKDVSDYMKKHPVNIPEQKTRPIDENMTEGLIPQYDILQTPLGRMIGSTGAGALGVVEGLAGAGEYLGVPGSEDVENKVNEWVKTIAPSDPNFAEQLASGVGSSATFFIPGLGAAKGVNILTKVTPKLANLFGLTAMTMLESASEAGQVYNDTKDPRAAEKSFLANMLLVGITNKYDLTGESANVIKKILIQAPLEGLQEAGQEIIQAKSKDEDINWDNVITSAGIGTLIGGGATAVLPSEVEQSTQKKESEQVPNEYNFNVRAHNTQPQEGLTQEKLPLDLQKELFIPNWTNPPDVEGLNNEVPEKNELKEFKVTPYNTLPQDGITQELLPKEINNREIEERRAEQKKQKEKKKYDDYAFVELNRQFKNARRKKNLIDEEELSNLTNNISTPEIKEKAEKLVDEVRNSNKKIQDRSEFTLENLSHKRFGTRNLNSLDSEQQQNILNEYNSMKKQGITLFKQPELVKPQLKPFDNEVKDAVQERSAEEILRRQPEKVNVEGSERGRVERRDQREEVTEEKGKSGREEEKEERAAEKETVSEEVNVPEFTDKEIYNKAIELFELPPKLLNDNDIEEIKNELRKGNGKEETVEKKSAQKDSGKVSDLIAPLESQRKELESKYGKLEDLSETELKNIRNQKENKETITPKVEDVPISSIKTDEDRFQNRALTYSPRTVKAIEENYNPAKFDPVVLWKDPEDNNTYVLSGHSRLEGMKRRNAENIPARYFEGSENEAIKFARLESNRSASKESLLEDIKAYKYAIENKVPKKELQETFPNGQYKALEDLSRLNDKGMFLSNLNSDNKEAFPYLERNARWVGQLRAEYLALTDAHENEMFDYFYREKNKNLRIKKDDFFSAVEKQVNRADFSDDSSLMLDSADKTTGVRARADTADLQKQIDELAARKKEAITDKERDALDSKIEKLKDNIKEITSSQLTFLEDREKYGVDKSIEPAETFYSKLEKVTEEKAPGTISSNNLEQYLSMLKKNGVRDEEIEWLGIRDYIKENDKVSKDDLVDYIRQNNVQIEEVQKQEKPQKLTWQKSQNHYVTPDYAYRIEKLPNDMFNLYSPGGKIETFSNLEEAQKLAEQYNQNSNRGNTKYSRYTLPGGKNYKELLLKLPDSIEPSIIAHVSRLESELEGAKASLSRWKSENGNEEIIEDRENNVREIEAELTKYRQKIAGKPTDSFKSSHFDEPNILAHIRFNERSDNNGNNILFIEEIQSDWHQKGRQEGYKEKYNRNELKVLPEDDANVFNNHQMFWFVETPEQVFQLPRNTYKTAEDAIDHVLRNKSRNKGSVPNAPFKKNWHELVLKRMLRYAAENGYDGIAWTPGEKQAERYDLSKHLTSIKYKKYNQGKTIEIFFQPKHQSTFTRAGVFTPEKLPDIVGKELTEKITSSNEEEEVLSGLDLTVGGEGMKGFYDNMIPSFLNKYAKKWGAKVDETQIDVPDILNSDNEKSIGVPFLPVTAKMKESVLAEGQPLFEDQYQYKSDDANEITKLKNYKKHLELVIPELEKQWFKNNGIEYNRQDSSFRQFNLIDYSRTKAVEQLKEKWTGYGDKEAVKLIDAKSELYKTNKAIERLQKSVREQPELKGQQDIFQQSKGEPGELFGSTVESELKPVQAKQEQLKLFEKNGRIRRNIYDRENTFGSKTQNQKTLSRIQDDLENAKANIKFNAEYESGLPKRTIPEEVRVVLKAFREKGEVSLIGLQLGSNHIQDIADAYKIFRDPFIEVAHIIGRDDNNKIVANVSYSSGASNYIYYKKSQFDDIIGSLQNRGAKKVTLLHNHPSGNPNPSRADITLSSYLREKFKKGNLDLDSSVVINGDKYSAWTLSDDAEIKPKMYRYKSPKEHPLEEFYNEFDSFPKIKLESDMAPMYLAQLKYGDGNIAVIVTDNNLRVRGYEYIHKNILDDVDRFSQYIDEVLKSHGGATAFIAGKEGDITIPEINKEPGNSRIYEAKEKKTLRSEYSYEPVKATIIYKGNDVIQVFEYNTNDNFRLAEEINKEEHIESSNLSFENAESTEGVKRKNLLMNQAPIKIDAESFKEIKDIKELRNKAQEVYRELKPAINKINHHTVEFIKRGFIKIRSHSADRKYLEIIPHLEEIFEKSVPIFSEPTIKSREESNIVRYNHYAAKVKIGDEEQLVRLVTYENKGGKEYLDCFYDARLTGLDKISASLKLQPTPDIKTGGKQFQAHGDKLVNWLHKVKAYEESQNINREESEEYRKISVEEKRSKGKKVSDYEKLDGNSVDIGQGIRKIYDKSAGKIQGKLEDYQAGKKLGLYEGIGDKIRKSVIGKHYKDWLTNVAWFFDQNPQLQRVWDAVDQHLVRNINEDNAILIEDFWKNGRPFRKLDKAGKAHLMQSFDRYINDLYNMKKEIGKTKRLTYEEFAERYQLKGETKDFFLNVFKPLRQKQIELIEDHDKYLIVNTTKNNPYLEDHLLSNNLDDFLDRAKKDFFDIAPKAEGLFHKKLLEQKKENGSVDEIKALNDVWNENKEVRELVAEDLVEQKYREWRDKVEFPTSRLNHKYYVSGYKPFSDVDRLMYDYKASGDKVFYTTNSLAEAQRMVEELTADGYLEPRFGEFKKMQDVILDNSVTTEDLIDLVVANDINVDNETVTRLLNSITAKGFTRHFIEKNYIPGFEFTPENFEKALVRNMNGVVHFKNRTIGLNELSTTMQDLKKRGIIKEGSNEADYLNKLRVQLDSQDYDAFRALRSAASVWYLTRPAYYAQQSFQPFQTLLPYLPVVEKELGLKGGEGEKAFGEAIIKAHEYYGWKIVDKVYRLANKKLNTTFGIEPEFLDVIKRLERQGVGRPLRSLELSGKIVDPQRRYNLNPLTEGMSYIGMAAGTPGILLEDFTRAIGIRAFYNLGKKAGLSGDELLNEISNNIAKTYGPASGKLSKPPGYQVGTGGKKETMVTKGWRSLTNAYLTFKNFGFMNYGQWGKAWRVLKNDKLYRSMLYKTASSVGVSGFKFMMWSSSVMFILRTIADFFNWEESPEEKIHDIVKKADDIVPNLGTALYKGLASTFFKVDLSSLFSQSAPFISEDLMYYQDNVSEAVGGAPMQVAKDLAKILESRDFMAGAPTSIRNLQKAEEWKERGVRYGTKTLVEAAKNKLTRSELRQLRKQANELGIDVDDLILNAADIVKKKMGFTPLKVSDAYERETAKRFRSQQFSDRIRREVGDEIIPLIDAKRNRNARVKLKELFKEAKRLNFDKDIDKLESYQLDRFVSQIVNRITDEEDREKLRNYRDRFLKIKSSGSGGKSNTIRIIK